MLRRRARPTPAPMPSISTKNKAGITDAMLGKWLEIHGKLEK